MMKYLSFAITTVGAILFLLAVDPGKGQKKDEAGNGAGASDPVNSGKKKGKGRKRASIPGLATVSPLSELNDPEVHEDFPAMCLNEEGLPVIAYIEHREETDADTLKVAVGNQKGALRSTVSLSPSDIDNIYQPCITRLANGRMLCVWSQLEKDGQWDLMARVIGRRGLAAMGEPVRLTDGMGNDIFADLGTDRHGRVWVTWQRIKDGVNRVMVRSLAPGATEWSEEIEVTDGKEGGDWEPRLAFGSSREALIVFDSYRNGNFDVFFSKVSPDGTVSNAFAIADSGRYEARAGAAASPDGSTLWVAYEDGMKHWGKDLGSEWRKKGGGFIMIGRSRW